MACLAWIINDSEMRMQQFIMLNDRGLRNPFEWANHKKLLKAYLLSYGLDLENSAVENSVLTLCLPTGL